MKNYSRIDRTAFFDYKDDDNPIELDDALVASTSGCGCCSKRELLSRLSVEELGALISWLKSQLELARGELFRSR